MERRYKNLQNLATMVECCCTPTPFVYQEILCMAENERQYRR